ncbi:MAG: AAA family ATPase [Candidatus Thorarchaeota archaeon]|nr:AAA family ATPase [Candidatus Thorarchaeota archaeon]
MPKRKESGVELPSPTHETTKKTTRTRANRVPRTISVTLDAVGYPFRVKGEPRSASLEIDNPGLFVDYARAQWAGTVVRTGAYLFDRYIMPDFAFQVIAATPDESVITDETEIHLTTLRGEPPQYTAGPPLSEVIGHEEVKRKCRLILAYLDNPQKLGEWAPRAVLFYGGPGTGKTMTARALAHEAKARIFLTKASDMIGVYVGEGSRRIGSLFDEARRAAPSIVFIDELDAIGLARSFQSIRGDVSETVTALLGELDRNADDSGVVVIGATNAPGLIDPALRSRFDTVFEFGLPNVEDRLRILRLYSARLPLRLETDLGLLAARTEGLSGRDLRDRILKESLHIAICEGKTTITDEIVLRVLQRVRPAVNQDYVL